MSERVSESVRRAVDRRAGSLTPASGPSFARGLWRIAAADVSSGNTVSLLHDGPATFAAMLDAIKGAESLILFECYIFRSDDVGHEFTRALIDAAQRGVKVQ